MRQRINVQQCNYNNIIYNTLDYENNGIVYITQYKGCSSGMHNPYGKYVYRGSYAKKLIPLLKDCGLEVESSKVNNKNYLTFSSPRGTGCFQRMMFKFVRYTGVPGTEVIVKHAIKAHKQGIDPFTSILLGHYCNIGNLPYYSPAMDMLGRIDNNVSIPASKEEILKRCKKSSTISGVFKKKYDLKLREKVYKLVKQCNYEQAEKLLNNVKT